VASRLTFKYDREADILHIDKCMPYAARESEEFEDEIIVRLNPDTGEVENLEVLFFSTRLLRSEMFDLPLTAHLELERREGASRPLRGSAALESSRSRK
jgi:uncharacterized protein YuzE